MSATTAPLDNNNTNNKHGSLHSKQRRHFLDRNRRRQRERRFRRSSWALVGMGQLAIALIFLSGCVYYLRIEFVWNTTTTTINKFQSAVQVNHDPHGNDRTTDLQRRQQRFHIHPPPSSSHPNPGIQKQSSKQQQQQQQQQSPVLQLPLYDDANTFFGTLIGTKFVHSEGSSTSSQDELLRLQNEFVDRYTRNHSIDQARELLQLGLSGSPEILATKLLQKHDNEISIWIMGSSSAAGYGNQYEYSYASVLEELLAWPSSWTNTVTVRSMAMKELTEFPITWCAYQHYWKNTLPTMIVWDFGEELSKPHLPRLEAFLRFLSAAVVETSQTNNHEEEKDDDWIVPITVLFRGIHTEEQWYLIQQYSAFIDPVIVRDHHVPVPPPSSAPMATGFREFYQFSATGPDTLHAHNLSVQQHALVAWLIAMHITSAWKLSLGSLLDIDHQENYVQKFKSRKEAIELPKLLYISDNSAGQQWENLLINPITSLLHCRTTFDYTEMHMQKQGFHQSTIVRANITEAYILSDFSNLIISGKAESSFETALEMLLLPKTQEFYNKGWVLDLDAETKRSKLLTKSSGNFWGFRDWKMAYYGVPQSGPLELLIPIDDTESSFPTSDPAETKNSTLTLLIMCEADAILPPPKGNNDNNCRLHRDVTFTVNGQLAQSVLVDSDIVATTSGRRTCVQITAPSTDDGQSIIIQKQTTEKLSSTQRSAPAGILLKVAVTNPQVSWKNGPCSIAYVIWSV
jgi:hypothetical protein